MLNARARRILFLIPLSVLACAVFSWTEDIPWQWTGVGKVVVVGDLHGDYENFTKILQGTGVVDRDLHWAAKTTHFVQTGDVLDRGPEARKILDLLIRLEKEALAAGGMVHVLLGNHEEINLTGIVFTSNPDYVTLDQFISFLPERYRKKQEDELTRRLIKLRAKDPNQDLEGAINAFWKSLRADPGVQRLYLLNLNDEYGPWLRRLNVAIKINDVIYVHGGISEKYSKWGLQEINDRYRMELAAICRTLRGSGPPLVGQLTILYRGDSPLWYRELATVPEADLDVEFDAILANLGARAMIIAHTPTIPKTPRDMQRFDGRLWIVDTGISRAYRGRPSALVIQNGDFHVWGVDYESDDSRSRPAFSACFSAWAGLLDARPAGR
jgi:hypothetical protein